MKKFTILITMLFVSLYSFAGILKGKVTDEKGHALPFATVYIKGTTIGTSTNDNGIYQLNVAPGKYHVLCQYIGYKQQTFNVTITGDETVEHNFALADQSLQMKEVVVHANAEDPAYPIIRNTIARRAFHLKQVRSFQTSIYLKGAFRTRLTPSQVFGQDLDESDMGLDSNGKGVIYLCEEMADYYSKLPDKQRTVIHSVHESGDPNGMGFSQIPSVITFYENNINLLTTNKRGFVSPISDNALFYYRYKLLGEFKESGHTIYKIKVTPKRKYEPLFYGDIYIVDNDWAIHSLDMTLTKNANLNLLDTIEIKQVFLPLKKDTWVIKNQVLYATLGILGFDITGNFVTVYNNQKVNEAIPDTMFHKNIVSVYDSTANEKDSTYWENTRPIPLKTDEVHDYKIKDSIRKRNEDPKYIDSVRRVGNKIKVSQILYSGLSQHTKGNKGVIMTNSLLSGMVNYNTVEGLNIAPKVLWTHEFDTSKVLQVKAAVRYGFSNTHLNAITRIAYTLNDRNWINRYWQIGVQGGKYVFQYNSENPVPELYNTISTLFYNQNYLKIYERWDASIFASRNYGNGLSWQVSGSYQQRIPLQNTTDYTFTGGGANKLTENAPGTLDGATWTRHDAVIAKASISYKPGYTYTLYPKYKMPHNSSSWPLFTLSYEKGIPNVLNSAVDFDKWRFDIRQDVRLKLLGELKYNIAAGGFLNKKQVSLPDMMHLYGNQFTALPIGFYMNGFELAPYYRYSNTNNLYGEAHIEYDLLGMITNKIPLFRALKWYAVVGNNTFYTANGSYYTEAFIGIDHIGIKMFRIFRFDFVQSWDSYGHTTAGIRIGITPNGLIPIKQKRGEW